jgi:hypothetical protein
MALAASFTAPWTNFGETTCREIAVMTNYAYGVVRALLWTVSFTLALFTLALFALVLLKANANLFPSQNFVVALFAQVTSYVKWATTIAFLTFGVGESGPCANFKHCSGLPFCVESDNLCVPDKIHQKKNNHFFFF